MKKFIQPIQSREWAPSGMEQQPCMHSSSLYFYTFLMIFFLFFFWVDKCLIRTSLLCHYVHRMSILCMRLFKRIYMYIYICTWRNVYVYSENLAALKRSSEARVVWKLALLPKKIGETQVHELLLMNQSVYTYICRYIYARTREWVVFVNTYIYIYIYWLVVVSPRFYIYGLDMDHVYSLNKSIFAK